MALLTGAGRIGRLHYFLINLACALGLLAPAVIGAEADPDAGTGPPTPVAVVLVILLVFLVGAWVSITTSIRRLHDCGRTGWLVLLSPLPLLGFALGLYLLFNPGNPLPNRYGPPPGSPDPEAMRAQLAKLEAVTAPYIQGRHSEGDDDDGLRAPAQSAWANDAATFDAMALYRENPGLAPPR
ncbi:MAG: DUF805 domain-containing protein [Acidimicrobiales bacterium]